MHTPRPKIIDDGELVNFRMTRARSHVIRLLHINYKYRDIVVFNASDVFQDSGMKSKLFINVILNLERDGFLKELNADKRNPRTSTLRRRYKITKGGLDFICVW